MPRHFENRKNAIEGGKKSKRGKSRLTQDLQAGLKDAIDIDKIKRTLDELQGEAYLKYISSLANYVIPRMSSARIESEGMAEHMARFMKMSPEEQNQVLDKVNKLKEQA